MAPTTSCSSDTAKLVSIPTYRHNGHKGRNQNQNNKGLMWVVNGPSQPSLADYMVMVNFMAEDFVDEAFTVYNHSRGVLQLCFLLDAEDGEEFDSRLWFPMYNVKQYDDWHSKLDQKLAMDACMLMAMANCDLIQTKNLKNTRSHLCRRLGITVSDTSVVVE